MTQYARSAAIVWLNYIANGLGDQYTPEENKRFADSALQIIKELQEQNAVVNRVVMCKDCVFAEDTNLPWQHGKKWCDRLERFRDPNWFCADVKRRTE